MLKHFRLLPFVLGVIAGIIGIYFVKPEQTVTMQYPTPDRAEKAIYKDKNGICYKYSVKKVDCDKNEGKMKNFPIT